MENDYIPVRKEDIPKVVEIVLETNSYNRNDVLVSLAVCICTDIKFVRKVKQDLQKKEIKLHEAFFQVLENWWNENKNKASVEELVSALGEKNIHSWSRHAKILHWDLALALTKKSEVTKVENEEADVEEDSIMLGLPNFSDNIPREKALRNPFILEEIFKKLNHEDKENFRSVNSFWWNKSLACWRESSRIHIIHDDDQYYESDEEDPDEYYYEDNSYDEYLGIELKKFIELSGLLKKVKESTQQHQPKVSKKPIQLLEHPYRSLRIYSEVFLNEGGFSETNWRRYENLFWTTFGSHFESLRISKVKFSYHMSFLRIFKKLVLDVAPNLKKLHIDKTCREWKNNEGEQRSQEFFPGRNFAEKLETLVLHTDISKEDTTQILQLCPNLKSLSAISTINIEGLLEPSANGEYIKLQELKICPYPAKFPMKKDDFLILRNYTELLPNTLKHLKLAGVCFNDNVALHNIYTALANCRNLQILELHLFGQRRPAEGAEFHKRFIDLPVFSFANLQKLKIQLMKRDSETDTTTPVLFDFGTLMVMSKLVELDVNISDTNKQKIDFKRKPGVEDWIYEGPGNVFELIAGIAGSEKKPIFCESLKKFYFFGWDITAQDVHIISKWFPNLTSLSAPFSPEALPVMAESWRKLENLEITTVEFIHFSKLRPLKDMNKNIRIMVHINSLLSVKVIEDENGCMFYEKFCKRTAKNEKMEKFWFGSKLDEHDDEDALESLRRKYSYCV